MVCGDIPKRLRERERMDDLREEYVDHLIKAASLLIKEIPVPDDFEFNYNTGSIFTIHGPNQKLLGRGCLERSGKTKVVWYHDSGNKLVIFERSEDFEYAYLHNQDGVFTQWETIITLQD